MIRNSMLRIFPKLLFFIFLSLASSVRGESVIQKFEIWGQLDEPEKGYFLMGYFNGLFEVRLADQFRPLRPFVECVESMSISQRSALIDKYYKNNPEKWSNRA